jgi:hypothetical protein
MYNDANSSLCKTKLTEPTNDIEAVINVSKLKQ